MFGQETLYFKFDWSRTAKETSQSKTSTYYVLVTLRDLEPMFCTNLQTLYTEGLECLWWCRLWMWLPLQDDLAVSKILLWAGIGIWSVSAQSALSVDLIQLFPKLHLVHLRARFLPVMASVDLDDLMKINIIGIVNNLYIDKSHQSLQGIRM